MKNKKVDGQENPAMEIAQFQFEIQWWKQLLNSRMEDNILLKNSLSDILKNNFDHNLLDEIEEFQSKFIREDEVIHSLRNDVNEMDSLMHEEMCEEPEITKAIDNKINNLRKSIASSATHFLLLKSAFDGFQNKIC